ncbi:M50 family metallopeptidase [Phycicoccus duodecadis]|uniref:Peptidase M50B-like protein n=1 Tax=Phycicoccus duodecadis TaxID=173053 RepID=A0A2N3YJD0_9MICO|nr:M50 family metallopeptidase [Phycicoccus duodecadis]PKW26954.1 peptidase M50B-like protein [Phycicoccus duodecadis]
MDVVGGVWARVQPVGDVALAGAPVVVVLVAALVAVGVPGLWRVLRLGVTLVHELGHAGVGMAVGRRFTGFVLRGDMSGHAVTVGPARGAGRVVTTWAGYPAPAAVGAAAVWLAVRGWSGAMLAVVVVVLVVALVRVRSALTAVVVVAVTGLTGWLFWAGPALVQAQVLVAAGLVLVVGAWRHLGAVAGTRDASSDAGVLARLTGVPRVVWLASFALVCAGATWVVARAVLAALRSAT